MAHEVINRGLHEDRIFVEVPQPNIAEMTEQPSDLAGLMVVVNVQPATPLASAPTARAFTNSAYTSLGVQNIPPLQHIDTVVKFKGGILGSLNRKVRGLKFGCVSRNLNSGDDLMVVSSWRPFITAWLMGHKRIVAILNPAVRTWPKNPTLRPGSPECMSGISFSGVSVSPPVKSFEIAAFAGGLASVRAVAIGRKVYSWCKLLAHGANLRVLIFLRGFIAIAPRMAKKAFGRDRFSAPFACNYSLCCTCAPGHSISWGNVESLNYTNSVTQILGEFNRR